MSGTDYWRFRFTSAKRRAQGLPRSKDFLFPARKHLKSQVETIRDEYELKYRAGTFDPWTDPIPDPCEQKVKSNVVFSRAMDEYTTLIPSELADTTVKSHTSYLHVACREFGDPILGRITEKQLTDYVNGFEKWGTRQTIKAVLDRFFMYAVRQGYIDRAPKVIAYSTRSERKEIKRGYITEAEFGEFLAAMTKDKAKKLKPANTPTKAIHDKYRRLEALFTVAFYMGLRMGDLLHCRPAWILNDFTFLRIGDLNRWNLPDSYTPKSQKEHDPPIAIPPEAAGALRQMAMSCANPYERLFGYRSARYVQKCMKDIAEEAFGKQRAATLSPHSLRHSCASYWLNERRIPVQEVQHLLRHADIKTTMAYHHHSTDAHFAAFNGGVMRPVKKSS